MIEYYFAIIATSEKMVLKLIFATQGNVLSECHPFAHTDSKRCFQGLLVIVRGAEK
jgi:hypothetical protein